jgi:hypothetical protein
MFGRRPYSRVLSDHWLIVAFSQKAFRYTDSLGVAQGYGEKWPSAKKTPDLKRQRRAPMPQRTIRRNGTKTPKQQRSNSPAIPDFARASLGRKSQERMRENKGSREATTGRAVLE